MRRANRKPWAYARTAGKAPLPIRVENAAGGVEVFLYDYIDADADAEWGGVSSSMIRDALPASGDVTVRINSPGGNVREGIAILNALRLHNGQVNVQIDGLAASAASFIAMAGDTIVMMPNTEMMIHEASMMTWGNAAQLRDDADYLDRMSTNIADVYAQRSGTPAASWRAAMQAESWYSAQEAVDAGLADSVMTIPAASKGKAAAAVAGNTWDLPYARYASRRDAPGPSIARAPDPVPEPDRGPETLLTPPVPISDYAAFVDALSKEAVT
jgi:ATP-dependent protease ClpP protease subunit